MRAKSKKNLMKKRCVNPKVLKIDLMSFSLQDFLIVVGRPLEKENCPSCAVSFILLRIDKRYQMKKKKNKQTTTTCQILVKILNFFAGMTLRFVSAKRLVSYEYQMK